MLASLVRGFSSAKHAFEVTPAAAAQIKKMLGADNDKKMLRIDLKKIGVEEIQYIFRFDAHAGSNDNVFKKDGAQVVLDDQSLAYFHDSKLDYVEDNLSKTFRVILPSVKEMHFCTCTNPAKLLISNPCSLCSEVLKIEPERIKF